MIRRSSDGQSSAVTCISTLDEAHALLNPMADGRQVWTRRWGAHDGKSGSYHLCGPCSSFVIEVFWPKTMPPEAAS